MKKHLGKGGRITVRETRDDAMVPSSDRSVEFVQFATELSRLHTLGEQLEDLIFHSPRRDLSTSRFRRQLLEIKTRICEIELHLGIEQIKMNRYTVVEERSRREPGA